MTSTTLDIVRAAFRADPTLGPADRNRLLAILRNGGRPEATPATTPTAPTTREPLRVIRRAEAAARLSVALRTVDDLARRGVLHKFTLPGRTRAAGFAERDVERLIEGRGMQAETTDQGTAQEDTV